MVAIEKLQLNIDAYSVIKSIMETKKIKLKGGVIKPRSLDTVRIYPPPTIEEEDEDNPSSISGGSGDSMLYALQKIKTSIPQVIVQGVPNVNRAVINDKGDGSFNLLVEGYNLRGVMTTVGVNGTETTSNHIIEVSNQRNQSRQKGSNK
jgi:DNA-directed RNA polymerase III subunit RPC1